MTYFCLESFLIFISLIFSSDELFLFCFLRFANQLAISVSVIGELMVARRYMESFILLYLSQLFGMLIWLQGMFQTGFNMDSMIMITYFIATFTNSVYSYYLWRKVYKKAATKQGSLLAKRKIKINRIIKLRNKFKELYWDKKIDIAKNS